MLNNHEPDDVIRMLLEWAEARETVRAVLLTSSRATAVAVDALSDYDVILVVQDVHPFYEDRTWLGDFGEVMVVYWDPIHPAPGFAFDEVSNVTQYVSGLHIDFHLWPVRVLQEISAASRLPDELDSGYSILRDKDHITDALRPPTFKAYVPSPPTDSEYQATIQDFFSDVPYVAKCLWRDELLPAKWCLDFDMKHVFLRRMLEWRVEIDHAWSLSPGNLGRGLKQHLPAGIWNQLEGTFTGAAIAANWEALYKTLELFRHVAQEVGSSLGYSYPSTMDEQVTAYARSIMALAHDASG